MQPIHRELFQGAAKTRQMARPAKTFGKSQLDSGEQRICGADVSAFRLAAAPGTGLEGGGGKLRNMENPGIAPFPPPYPIGESPVVFV